MSQGEATVIMEPSGSGKSTLLRCINRREDATSGTVIVNSHDILDEGYIIEENTPENIYQPAT
jgi:ABC-type proline/glycine betaine transport system ATPase subunit